MKDYVSEQVTIRRDEAGPKRKTGMDLDTLNELHKLITDEDDWNAEGESCCQEFHRGKGGEADDIENKGQQILIFVKRGKEKAKEFLKGIAIAAESSAIAYESAGRRTKKWKR